AREEHNLDQGWQQAAGGWAVWQATQRACNRRTNLSPDQTSVTVQTFTSTTLASRPIRRTTSSVRSVSTVDAFLGQATQSMPAGGRSGTACLNAFSRCALETEKSRTQSAVRVPRPPSATP